MNLGKYLLAAFIALTPASAAAADWWWIGFSGDPPSRFLTYLDAETIAQGRSRTVEVWTLAISESPSVNGMQHQAVHYALKCRDRSYSIMETVGYDSAGAVLPLAKTAPSEFVRATPGSIGEAVIQFACGRPSGMEVHVAEPVRHAFEQLASAGRPVPPGGPPPGGGEPQATTSFGTGFFVGPEGHVLTSYHVVAGSRRIGCRTADGTFHPATVSRVSAANDLALLRVGVRPADWLGFAPPGSLRPGDRVFTIGYGAAGYLGVSDPRFTDGTVSALTGAGDEHAYMQISVPVQPGNSGGPLLNEAGQVVGIIAAQAAVESFVEAVGTLPQNINWAVKAEYASPMLPAASAPPGRTRDQAIENAQRALCLIVADTSEG